MHLASVGKMWCNKGVPITYWVWKFEVYNISNSWNITESFLEGSMLPLRFDEHVHFVMESNIVHITAPIHVLKQTTNFIWLTDYGLLTKWNLWFAHTYYK